MTLEELKDEVYTAMVDKHQQWRDGQFVFNYIDYKYKVARQIQFQDNVDCFYLDSEIDAFLKCAVERINK